MAALFPQVWRPLLQLPAWEVKAPSLWCELPVGPWGEKSACHGSGGENEPHVGEGSFNMPAVA